MTTLDDRLEFLGKIDKKIENIIQDKVEQYDKALEDQMNLVASFLTYLKHFSIIRFVL
jgi:hypothetical protein